MNDFTRKDVSFDSHGALCRAWYYLPEQPVLENRDGAPCIIMAHGFGGTRDAGLEPFAERFAAAGLHVVLFDYRHFGASDGEPRQLLSIGRQLEDWHSAIAFARGIHGVDPRRIGLWGSSFSGGHVVVAAAQDGKVAAISSQGPMLDGLATVQNVMRYAGAAYLARSTAVAMRDAARGLVGGEPHYMPVVGEPGELAAMSTPDAKPGYLRIAPAEWHNHFTPRVMLRLGSYRPIRYVRRLPCSALFVACTRDSVVSPETARKAARLAGDAGRLLELDIGHFDIYVDDGFEQAVEAQRQFFLDRLAVRS